MAKNTSLPKNVQKKAVQYIKHRLKEGDSAYSIRRELLEKDYSGELADELIQKAKKKSIILPILSIIIALGIIVFAIQLFYPLTSISGNECTDTDCFITAANGCNQATLKLMQADSLFKLETKDCRFKKTLTRINDSEPQDIKDIFNGKSLNCSYMPGEFNSDLVYQLSIGIENCTGELKDAIDLIAP